MTFDYGLILTVIIAAATGIIAGMYVQTRLDISGYTSKWIDAAKIGRAVQEFFGPLEVRVTKLEKDHTHFLALINLESNHLDHTQDNHDADRAESNVVRADRNKLLGTQAVLQQQTAVIAGERNGWKTHSLAQHDQITQLEIRITQLENEITRLMSQTQDDTEGFDTSTIELKARDNE